MKLIGYEWLKLARKKLFWALAAALLAGNLLTLYTFEKNTSAFFYVREQRETYLAFLAGDTSVDVNGWYQSDLDAQTVYQETYAVFTGEMEDRAEQMRLTAIFSGEDSYVYRNLRKTCADFAPFAGLELETDNCYGLRALARYNTGVLFLLVFLAVLAYFVIFYERDMNLILLLKGNRHGHTPLALSKLTVMLSAAVLYALLQEAGAVLFLGWSYGYGELSRPIQSVSLFRNCAHRVTVGQGLAAILLIRILAAVLFASALFCIGMCIRNEAAALVTAAAVLGGECILSRVIPLSSGLNWLKCLNPFYCWDMGAVLGEYLNLDLFGWPVNKERCAAAAAALLIILLPLAGVLVFNRTCQVKVNSRLEGLMQRLRGALSFLGRRTSLLYYEFCKALIQQKKGIVLLLLIAWGIYETAAAFGPIYYATARDAAYRSYIERLQGPVTEETEAFMEEEEARLNALWLEMMELGSEPSGSGYVRQIMIQAELERLEDGFWLVRQQLDALKEKPGDIGEKYLMDERSYISLWWDTDRDLALFFIGSAALLFLICGLHTMDEKRGMLPLLRSTRNGRRKLERSKTVCALLCTLFVFLMTEGPLFLRCYRIDHFVSAGQRLSDFTQIPFTSTAPLAALIAAVFALKALCFAAVCLGGLRLSKITKNEMVALLGSIGAAGAVTVVLHHFDWDVNMLLIRFLQ